MNNLQQQSKPKKKIVIAFFQDWDLNVTLGSSTQNYLNQICGLDEKKAMDDYTKEYYEKEGITDKGDKEAKRWHALMYAIEAVNKKWMNEGKPPPFSREVRREMGWQSPITLEQYQKGEIGIPYAPGLLSSEDDPYYKEGQPLYGSFIQRVQQYAQKHYGEEYDVVVRFNIISANVDEFLRATQYGQEVLDTGGQIFATRFDYSNTATTKEEMLKREMFIT